MDPFFVHFFPHEGDALGGYHEALRRRLTPSARLLDLGCGSNGGLDNYRTPRREVWGVDFQPHPDLKNAEWYRPLGRDGEIPFADGTFDVVASSWVLEHVRQPRQFLREVQRVLRPGGAFLSLTVNGRHYVSWISRLLRCLPHELTQTLIQRLYGRPSHDTFPTHYRLNTECQVQGAASGAGLRLAEVKRFANVDYFSFSPQLRRAAVVTDWALERVFPGLGRLYVVVTLEKPGAAVAGIAMHQERRAA